MMGTITINRTSPCRGKRLDAMTLVRRAHVAMRRTTDARVDTVFAHLSAATARKERCQMWRQRWWFIASEYIDELGRRAM